MVMNKVTLNTERTILKPMSEQDAESIVKWRNDDEVLKNLFLQKKITIEDHMNWFEKYQTDETRMEWVIHLKEGQVRIGTIGLSSIDYVNHSAEYGILIGEKEYWGQGYAFEVSQAILDFGYTNLKLDLIYLNVFETNIGAIKLYEKLGFKYLSTNEKIVHMQHFEKAFIQRL